MEVWRALSRMSRKSVMNGAPLLHMLPEVLATLVAFTHAYISHVCAYKYSRLYFIESFK